MAFFAPDLTQRAPRSPRVRLGGFVILPRALDKGRATIAKKNGEFKFDCPLDNYFFDFVGVKGVQFKKELAKGKSDSEMLEWIKKNGKNHPCHGTIHLWSTLMEQRVPTSVEMRAFFNELCQTVAPKREDIATWFDILDVDDYVSFGGQP